MNLDKRILSITAFALFIAGVVGPFVPSVFGSDDIACIFAIVASILAVILGFLGRSFLLGKVGMIGAFVVCLLGGGNYFLFRMEAAKARARQEQSLLPTNSR